MWTPIDAARQTLALGAVIGIALATPAAAEVRATLVDCDAGSCLLVRGDRADAGSAIRINGHEVAAQGARKWRVRVPVDTVRTWSAPYSRTITVSVAETHSEAMLPIGLLGHADLASLTVSVK